MIRETKVKNPKFNKSMCPQCGIFINCPGNLTKHIRRVHLKEKHFFCDLCRYVVKVCLSTELMKVLILISYGAFFKDSLENHLKTHLPRKFREKHYCDQCEYSSISSDLMKKHLSKGDHRSLSKKKVRSECHCGKVFQSTKALYIHKRNTHDKQLNHICNICEKAHPFLYQLKVRTLK